MRQKYKEGRKIGGKKKGEVKNIRKAQRKLWLKNRIKGEKK